MAVFREGQIENGRARAASGVGGRAIYTGINALRIANSRSSPSTQPSRISPA